METTTSNRARLLATAGIVAVPVMASIAATQYLAWRLNYHPGLGTPWVEHFYAPWSWAQWMQAPWAGNVSTLFDQVKAGAAGLAVLSMLALVGKSNGQRKPIRHEGVHGTSRFQTEEEIAHGVLVAREGKEHAGVYVGGWTDKEGRIHYLRHDGPEHCIVIAPTRSGKGVGNILPTLLSWLSSCLIYDEKGELWALTAGWREREAHNTTIRLEMGALQGSGGFNFLEEIRLGTDYEVGDAQAIAQMICDPNGDGIEGKDHWGKTSFDLLGATFLHLLYRMRNEGKMASLTDVAYAISDPDNPSDELWEEMRTNQHIRGKRHLFVASAGQDMIERNEKERKSVLSSAKTYLNLVKDPIVARNIKHSDFKIKDLMNHARPLSLYLTTKGTDKERLRPLTRLFLTMVMRTLMGVELTYVNGQAVMPHRHRLLMMLDEFPSLGKMNVIEDSLPKCAGYGIKMFLAAQDRSQLFKAYTQYQSITGNCHIRLIYAPNEGSTADWICHDMGDTTVIKQDVTESGTRLGKLKNISRTYHEVKRPLMTPTEIMALRKPKKDRNDLIVENGQMVIFQAGEWPILGTQILYFLDPVFSARSKMPPPAVTGTLRQRTNQFVAP